MSEPSNTNTVNVVYAQNKADLEAVKNASGTVSPGEQIIYTIRIRNNGPDAAAETKLSDSVPAELQNVQYSLDNQNWNSWSSPLNMGTLENAQTRTVYIRGTVAPGTPYGSVISNTARVETTSDDPKTDNNTSTVTTDVVDPCWAAQNRYRALTGVISSVAAEETAAAHIIQEEATKLKAAIAKSATPEQLLKVNESISNMMDELNKNNAVLAGKMDTAISVPVDTQCPPLDQDKANRQQALNDIIKSVANEEKAMADLMNAEAEKIIAVSANPNSSVKDMLDVNASASGLVNKVSTTNTALAKKLEKAVNTKP